MIGCVIGYLMKKNPITDFGDVMGKAFRKPRPSMPHWEWIDRDNCWFCKSRNNCNQCKANRRFAKEFMPKKEKGKH